MVRIATLADKRAVEAEMPVEQRWRARTLYEQLCRDGRALSRAPRDRLPAPVRAPRQGGHPHLVGAIAPRSPAPPTSSAASASGPATASPASCRTASRPPSRCSPGRPPASSRRSIRCSRPEHIASILRDGRAKVVVTLAPFPKTDLAQKVAEAVALAPNVETVLQVDLARYLAPPLSWIVPADPPEAPAGAPRPRPRPRRAPWPPRTSRGLDFAEPRRRPRLRLLPHRRHHRPAEGRAAPRQRHPLQRLVRQALHLHRGGRAHVPAAAVPRLRRLPDPACPAWRPAPRWSCPRRRAIGARASWTTSGSSSPATASPS